jgi:hypothetical protein
MAEKDKEKNAFDLPKIHARFRADFLHALNPILKSRDGFMNPGGLYVEPVDAANPKAGIIVIAHNGKSLAVFHDANGYCTAKAKIYLPKWFRKRCAPLPPVKAFLEGNDEIALPEYVQPGLIYLMPIAAWLLPKMPAPNREAEGQPMLAHVMIETGNYWRMDSDYRVEMDASVPWREIIKHREGQTSEIGITPHAMALFRRCFELSTDETGRGHIKCAISGPHDAIVLTIENLPFVGAFMPQKWDGDVPVPAFALPAEAA